MPRLVDAYTDANVSHRLDSTRLDGIRRTLCTGCIPATYVYANTTWSPCAPRHNLQSTERSRAAELGESFVLPRITRTMHANRNGFTVLFPPTMLQTSSPTSSSLAVKRKRDRSLEIRSRTSPSRDEFHEATNRKERI